MSDAAPNAVQLAGMVLVSSLPDRSQASDLPSEISKT